MGTIATDQQTRWRTCFATSERVKLTLGTNGEQKPFLIRPDGQVVYAGLEAPTVIPSIAMGGTGLTGYFYYVYVYASTQYPYIQNAQTTAGGELWPRSNPSPRVATGSVTDDTITITVTKTTRSDIDKILVYRTLGHSTSAEALAASDAGQYYYVKTIDNNGIAGTDSVTDATAATLLTELIELDNFTPDVAWYCTFDGVYWWMIGSPPWEAAVTVDGTTSVVITDGTEIFDGRNGMIATFDGVTTGGFDGRGSWYIGRASATTVTLYAAYDPVTGTLSSPLAINYSGTTTMHITGRASVLYRSKPYNPLSWGFTETLVTTTDNVENTTIVPQSFALELGGGSATAIAVVPSGKLLKVDFENPQRTITLDLESAELDTFGSTQRVIDNAGSITAHFSQFQGFINNDKILIGLDTYNGNILASDGFRQVVISDAIYNLLLDTDRTDDAHRFFHGVYDPFTNLNCFWVRLLDTEERINAMIWVHSATGEWGWSYDFDLNCSCVVLDSQNNERLIIGGTSDGDIGRIFYPENFSDWGNGAPWMERQIISTSYDSGSATFRMVIDFDLTAINNDGLTQIVLSVDENGGTFETEETPVFAVGDVVQLGTSGNEFSYGVAYSGTITSITGNVASYGASYVVLDSPETALVSPITRMEDQWSLVSSMDGTDHWWVHLTNGTSISDTQIRFDADKYFEYGSTDVLHAGDITTVPPWGLTTARLAFGARPCFYRTYFDLDLPTKDKSPFEIWTTANNVDTSAISVPLFTSRFYPEFNEESSASLTFALTQSIYDASVASDVWLNKHTPSNLWKQWGVEFLEVGFDKFTIMNYTIKVAPILEGDN